MTRPLEREEVTGVLRHGSAVSDRSSACWMRFGPAILGSFGESSVASWRKRGPVAFRPRLSAGFALLLFVVLSLYRLVARHFPIVNLMLHYSSDPRCPLWVISGPSGQY